MTRFGHITQDSMKTKHLVVQLSGVETAATSSTEATEALAFSATSLSARVVVLAETISYTQEYSNLVPVAS